MDKQGNVVSESREAKNEECIKFEKKWGKPEIGINPSTPVLIKPGNSQNEDQFNEKVY